jgi:hypothetical protein
MTALFAPDSLCAISPTREPLEDDGVRQEIVAWAREVLRTEPTRVDAGDASNGVTRGFVLDTPEGPVFLKTTTLADGHPRLAREEARARALAAEGAPVPRVLAPVSTRSGRTFLAFTRIAGRHFTGREGELRAAGHAVRNVELAAARGLDAGETAVDAHARAEAVRARLGRLWASALGDHRTRETAAEHEADVRRASEGLDLDAMDAVPPRWAHVDVHPLNLLVDDAGAVTVLDFEDLLVVPPAIARGFGLFKLARRAAVLERARLAGAVPMWVEATGSELSPAALQAGATLRVLELLVVVLGTAFDEGDPRYLFDFAKHARALRELEIVYEEGR